MTRIKATLFGIPQQKYEPQKFFHTSIKKPKIEYIELYSFEFNTDESFIKVKEGTKYNYIIYPKYRKNIEEKYNIKIPIFIKKLVWKLEEINGSTK